MTFDDAASIALTLPGTLRTTSYGTPAVKVGVKADGSGGKLLIRLRDDGDMVLKVEDGLREALLEQQPDVFYSTPHYDGYPSVLVHLGVADPEQIATLIERAWAGAATAKLRRQRG